MTQILAELFQPVSIASPSYLLLRTWKYEKIAYRCFVDRALIERDRHTISSEDGMIDLEIVIQSQQSKCVNDH